MKAKEWESECLEAFQHLSKQKIATARRYGVMAIMDQNKQWRPVPSYPDIEGVVAPAGQQFVFDCKVCSGPSFPLSKLREERKKQLNHMLERSRFGAICFFAVYFNPHETTRDYQGESAWAFPVWQGHELWRDFAMGATSTISRLACAEYAHKIEWRIPKGCQKARPDMLEAIRAVAAMRENDSNARTIEEECF